MSISVQELFEDAKYSYNGSGPTFNALFIRAVNRVTSDVNRQCGLTVEFVEDVSAEIDLDNTQHMGTYLDGVSYYIQKTGEFSKKPDEKKQREYERSLAMSQYHVINGDDTIPFGYPERA